MGNHFKMSIKSNNLILNVAKLKKSIPNCYFHSFTVHCYGPDEQLTCKCLPCHFWSVSHLESVTLVYGEIQNRGAPRDWN